MSESWQQSVSGHSSQAPYKFSTRPRTGPVSQSQHTAFNKASEKKKRAETKFKSGYWSGLIMRFSRGPDFKEGFTRKADRSYLSLLDHTIENPLGLAYATSFTINQRNSGLEIKETLTIPETPDRASILLMSRTAYIPFKGFTLLEFADRGGVDFIIKIEVKAGFVFQVDTLVHHDLAGEQANAMFLKAHEDEIQDMRYFIVRIPDYRRKDASDTSHLPKAEILGILQRPHPPLPLCRRQVNYSLLPDHSLLPSVC